MTEGISYSTANELNKLIDNKLPSRPKFTCREVIIDNCKLELHTRDILECIQTLWRDPDFVDHLILEPERQYTDEAKQNRMYHEMHTGDWWWETQVSSLQSCPERGSLTVYCLEKGRTRNWASGGNNCSRYSFFRQNSAHDVPEQVRISRLSHTGQHSEAHAPQAITSSTNSYRIPPYSKT